MELVHKDGIYVFSCNYNQRHWPKGAGFRWHGSPCQVRTCKVCERGFTGKLWWTDKPSVAIRLKEHADTACKKILKKYEVEVSKAVKESRAENADIDVPSPEGLDYRGFQKAGIAYALKRESTIIADDMGLGKTIQALGVVNAQEDQSDKVLVICPASLRLNWEREGTTWLVNNRRIRVVERDLPEDEDWDVLILNYDKFAGARREEFTKFCANRDWLVAILDEAHYLKNPKAQRTEAILATRSRKRGPKGAIGRARKKLFLTGTPILNRPVDLWPILKAVAPNEFNDFQHFTVRYCNRHFNGYAWDVSGASNLDELQEKLRSICMIRRLKKDVLKELPPKIRQIIPIPPSGRLNKLLTKEKKAYEKVEKRIKDLEAKVQKAFDSASTKSGKEGDQAKLAAYADNQYRQAIANLRRQMANFDELAEVRHDIAQAKLPFVVEQVENALAETDKVIVFAHHRDICEAIRDHFGKKSVLLYGGMSDREADRAVRRFQEDDKIKVFVGSIQAAGVGHTLTAASTVIFAELDWVPANMMQAEDRAHRIGQTDVVNVIYLVVDGSLDAHLAVTLINKQEVIESALDRKTEAEKQAELSERDVMEESSSESESNTIDVFGWEEAEEEEAEAEPQHESKLFRAAKMRGWPTKLAPSRPRKLPSSGAEDQEVAKAAMVALHEQAKGFNSYDKHLGRLLVKTNEFNDKHVDIARGLAQKYRALLPSRLLEQLGIQVVGQRNLF